MLAQGIRRTNEFSQMSPYVRIALTKNAANTCYQRAFPHSQKMMHLTVCTLIRWSPPTHARQVLADFEQEPVQRSAFLLR